MVVGRPASEPSHRSAYPRSTIARRSRMFNGLAPYGARLGRLGLFDAAGTHRISPPRDRDHDSASSSTSTFLLRHRRPGSGLLTPRPKPSTRVSSTRSSPTSMPRSGSHLDPENGLHTGHLRRRPSEIRNRRRSASARGSSRA
jgi:hypothetical protein